MCIGRDVLASEEGGEVGEKGIEDQERTEASNRVKGFIYPP